MIFVLSWSQFSLVSVLSWSRLSLISILYDLGLVFVSILFGLGFVLVDVDLFPVCCCFGKDMALIDSPTVFLILYFPLTDPPSLAVVKRH